MVEMRHKGVTECPPSLLNFVSKKLRQTWEVLFYSSWGVAQAQLGFLWSPLIDKKNPMEPILRTAPPPHYALLALESKFVVLKALLQRLILVYQP